VLSLEAQPFFSCLLAVLGKYLLLFNIHGFSRVKLRVFTDFVTNRLMPSHQLPNYLRTFRKRSYLSQDEVAYLLGCKNGSKISRYERFARVPNLKTAMAYAALFNARIPELFGGSFQKVHQQVVRRAQLLARKINAANPDAATARKLQALRAISGPRAESGRYHG
jgi:transcriptional regulator with XRE-family HTH domain